MDALELEVQLELKLVQAFQVLRAAQGLHRTWDMTTKVSRCKLSRVNESRSVPSASWILTRSEPVGRT